MDLAELPVGVNFGATNGISWGDYDGDDYPDVFRTQSKRLWRNIGGHDWSLAATLDQVLPNTQYRYGCAFGDWDADGVQDLATAPRDFPSDVKAHLLHNDGNTQFHDIAGNPLLVDVQPFGNAETLCWGDVDGDARLDLFVPVYPPRAGGPGNFFLHNAGPTISGEFSFRECSALAGLDNPPGSSQPEGAQFADIDGDGDLDLFSNGTLYRNRSTNGSPAFDALAPGASGIALQTTRDEGAQFFDYDLDGDLDLACVYSSSPGVTIWEARGDGTFFALEPGVIQSPLIGLDLVVGWAMSSCIDARLVVDALQMAIDSRSPAPGLLHHSDRGVQYAAHAFQVLLEQRGITCSMSGKGNCYDKRIGSPSAWPLHKVEPESIQVGAVPSFGHFRGVFILRVGRSATRERPVYSAWARTV